MPLVSTKTGLSGPNRRPGANGMVQDCRTAAVPSAAGRLIMSMRCTGSAPNRYVQSMATMPGSPPRHWRTSMRRASAGAMSVIAAATASPAIDGGNSKG